MTPANATALAKEAGFVFALRDGALCNCADILAFANLIEARVREEVSTEIADLKRQLGGGCEANGGGYHAAMQDGKTYWFCGDCGESLKGVRYNHMPPAAAIRSTDADHIAGDGK